MVKKEKDFYLEEVEVNNWLKCNKEKQFIRFKDRVEYRENGLIHKLDGPAIVYNDGRKEFFINGELYENVEIWKVDSNVLLRPIKLKEIFGDRLGS